MSMFLVSSLLLMSMTAATDPFGAAGASLTFNPLTATSKEEAMRLAAKDPLASFFSGKMQATQVLGRQLVERYKYSSFGGARENAIRVPRLHAWWSHTITGITCNISLLQ